MRVKRRFSTRWGHPYHLQGACTECRQTLLPPLCSITPMNPEGYTEYSAQSKRGDTYDGTTSPHRGKFAILDREVGVTTGTFRVRSEFANPGDLLRPGQFAKV